jgi:thiamine phosphate synthase YjbQ (UPF0047 family)
MGVSPTEITLHLAPAARLDVINVSQQIREELGDLLERYKKTLYCSHHTTAGYLEQSLCARLDYSRDRLGSLLHLFQQIFPPNANYEHDKLHLRQELSEDQRRSEPKNADSHLAFMSSGLKNCVTYANRPDAAAYLIDLDGVHEHGVRQRRTTALAYNRELTVGRIAYSIPVSRHPIDSVNLRDPDVGLFDQLHETVQRLGIDKGRVDISLAAGEGRSGLTVNEYETLLMRHDLAEVLQNPVRFMARHGKELLQNPRSILDKTRNYASYDVVRVLNELMDATGISESILERLIARFMAVPAQRFLRMKRSVSLLVSDQASNGESAIVQGTYQSPVLVQWGKAKSQARQLDIELIRFR